MHRRLLKAFTRAASEGDLDALVAMLTDDAVLITDGGPGGRRAGAIRNLRKPLHGVADARVHRVFFHADVPRLRHLGPRKGS